MATIKSYTDLEQSKKLAEILPIESADMAYRVLPGIRDNMPDQYIAIVPDEASFASDLPSWSLAALLGLIPHYTLHSPNPLSEKYCCICVEYEIETYGDTQLDAAFEMVCWLKENNKL